MVVDVPPDSRLATEEVFGPVLPVWRVEDLDEAIERANDTAYGLGSSIWTRDAVAIDRATRELEAGVTWVNQLHYGFDELPFGGPSRAASAASTASRPWRSTPSSSRSSSAAFPDEGERGWR